MLALTVLVPVGLIGLIAWIAVGVRTTRTEPVTLAGAASFYASLAMIVATTLALLGLAVAVKVIIGFINLSWSYGVVGLSGGESCTSTSSGVQQCTPSVSPSIDFTPQRTNDIVLAITLIVVGVVLAWMHRELRRIAQRSAGGLPGWVDRGTLMGFVILYGAAATFGVIAFVYGVITFAINGQTGSGIVFTGPFGDEVGAAAAFIPAWIVVFIVLRRQLEGRGQSPPPAVAPHPPTGTG
ncbi:MAG: hypothetical protein JOY68_07160 [Candidatus Dormibacteraeota bacterium]|nr:hypothetical protein [Candidatus Dormibacteraeota bacterium]